MATRPVASVLCPLLTFAIGKRLFDHEMKRANELWELRYKEPEKFEPVPAELRWMQRSERTYVMEDNSKLGIQEGKRGRGAPKPRTLKKLAQQAKRKAIQKAKRGKAGPQPVAEQPPEAAFANEENWKDVRALLIFRERDLATTGTKRRREILHRRVLAHVGTKEEWMRLVHLALYEEGVYVAHEVVIIADGGNARFGNSCRSFCRRHASAEEVRKCIKYFTDHQQRMRYAWYRKHDMQIGSGAIESVHAWVIQPRCRLPGMRWSIAGANAMLRLRCAWASGRFDEEFALAANSAPATAEELEAAA